jgi:hypothetical protein
LAASGCPARPPDVSLPPRQQHARHFTLPLLDPRRRPPMAVEHACHATATSPTLPSSPGDSILSSGHARCCSTSETCSRTPPLTHRRCTGDAQPPCLFVERLAGCRRIASLLSAPQRDAHVAPKWSSPLCGAATPPTSPNPLLPPPSPSVHRPGAPCTGPSLINRATAPPFLHFPHHHLPRTPLRRLLERRGALLLPAVELAAPPVTLR